MECRWSALLLLAGLAAAAQTPPKKKAAAPRQWPIVSLGVTGNRNFAAEKILEVSGLKPGQAGSTAAFDAARDRILATGFFATAGYRYEPTPDGKGYAATFEVSEVEPLCPVRFEDLPAPDEELRGVLERADPLFGARIPATDGVLKRYVRTLEEYLAKKGNREPLAGRVVADGPDRISVVFRPAAAPPVVAFVKFVNSSVLPAATLQNAMAGVAVGLPYSEARVRQLLDTAIRPLYEARGRLRVAFPKVEAAPAKDVKGLLVTVGVEEGPSYNLREVRIEGAPGSFGALLQAADLKTDDIANFHEVELGRQRVLKLVRRNGYMKADAAVERRIDDARKTVDVTIRVAAGPQFVFGKLVIEGLDLLTEPQVRKLWTLKPDKPFDADYPDYFLARLREDGVLDGLGATRSAIQADDQRRTVDVTLVFRGAPPPKRERKP
ncbi:MAG: hypothetical protein HY822_11830 [Acidobacteria bacterium]|nr:hypothetical protein [Acidobacteriota bacterium]